MKFVSQACDSICCNEPARKRESLEKRMALTNGEVDWDFDATFANDIVRAIDPAFAPAALIERYIATIRRYEGKDS